jgi:hypothetical protein
MRRNSPKEIWEGKGAYQPTEIQEELRDKVEPSAYNIPGEG